MKLLQWSHFISHYFKVLLFLSFLAFSNAYMGIALHHIDSDSCSSICPSGFPQDRHRSLLAPLISTTWPPPPSSPLPHISTPDSDSAAEIKVLPDCNPCELSFSLTSLTFIFYLKNNFLLKLFLNKRWHDNTNLCHLLASPRQHYWGCVIAWFMILYWMWLTS